MHSQGPLPVTLVVLSSDIFRRSIIDMLTDFTILNKQTAVQLSSYWLIYPDESL